MKKLSFGEGHLAPVLRGRKKITIRKFRKEAHDFKKGEVVVGIFKGGLKIALRITYDTQTKKLADLVDKEAEEDGFKNAEDAFQNLKKYYPDLKKEDTIGIIRFEVLKMDDELVVIR